MSETQALTLSEYVNVNNYGQVSINLDKATRAVNLGQISPAEYERVVYETTGRYVKPAGNVFGETLGYNFSDTPTYTKPNPINSNASTVSRGNVARPLATEIDATTGKVVTRPLSGIGSKVLTGAGLVGAAAMAVGTACQLGLTIDKTLYNANPDIFGNTPIGSLDPSAFEKMVVESAEGGYVGAKLLQAIFGIDPNTGETQMYIDENAYAYMAAYLQSIGVFDSGEPTASNPDYIGNLTQPFYVGLNSGYFYGTYQNTLFEINAPECVLLFVKNNVNNGAVYILSDSVQRAFTMSYGGRTYNYTTSSRETLNDKTWYYTSFEYYMPPNYPSSPTFNTSRVTQLALRNDRYTALYNYTVPTTYDGISKQDGATLPQNLTGNPTDDLNLLKQQYPDLWNDAIDYPVVQPDGNVKNYTYVPIPMPENYPRSSTQPETGNASQTNTAVDPATATDTLIQFLTSILNNPIPPTTEQIDNEKPPENPTDTGGGSSPVPLPPTGSASALWAIYHPTQGQIDSFGAWLWSSNFIDQIQKIFNNPMESIIGLHKVYATPIDAGTSTIGVGYLDSGVSSAYITQQYIDVDCGSVDLLEQFGNVFDYAPFTTVKLYLPFVGIVNLDVSEVMRSTIGINYGVDILTGACLAKVSVSRDGNDSILYQFAGNCAVQYPLSMGSYMGIVSSIVGVAGSIAATVASGGSVAPLALGAVGAAFNAHTSVQNSGNFSGNSGAMGGKIPYLIIERPQTRLADNQQAFSGTPTNEHVSLGSLSGYVRCSDMHITDINATDTELNEIKEYLRNGVIV